MDPLDVFENMTHVVPQFQPVMNSEECKIIGYEILGRFNKSGSPESLGWFFLDPEVPADYKWEADKEIYKKAVKKALKESMTGRLFFNVDPVTLLQLHCVEELMELLDHFCKEGLRREQIVLELRISDYHGDINDLSHMILYMKASGYHVTLDDIKTHDANLDQLSKLEPTNIKVDLSDLRESVNHFIYKDVLSALAIFSRKIGADLHFKGIQDAHQLLIAWKHSGRYLQGFYLQKPANDFSDPYTKQSLLEESIQSFIDMAHRKLARQIEFIKWMDEQMALNLKQQEYTPDQLAESVAAAAGHAAFRVYICDSYGYQLTANQVKSGEKEKSWKTDESARGKNWSWRTYFLAHIMQMKYRKTGMLSDKYRDIETNDLIRTYSYPVGDEQYIFIDLDPVFLFDNDWLL